MMLYANDIIFTLMIAAFGTSYAYPAVISYIMKTQQGDYRSYQDDSYR